MRSESRTETIHTFISEVHPEMTTEDEHYAEAMEWADNVFPVAWKIVMNSKSKAFGKPSAKHHGVLQRLVTLKAEHEKEDPFWGWRARFTIAHYEMKGFTSGFFQQFDGKYDRGCCYLDYTPKTRNAVIERFLSWCDVGYKFPTAALKIDGKIVRRYDPPR